VRSARFRIREEGGAILLSGSGLGHGVGLCQAGSARRAALGEGYAEILRYYFARARLGIIDCRTVKCYAPHHQEEPDGKDAGWSE
jgi:peptidoglycan hydrolase-like amidase